MDATGVAEAVRRGEITAVDTVTTSLERIASTAELNAFTVVLADSALERAAEVDAGRVTGPLAGVPISVKDHVWIEGLPATNGSRALADHVAPATCVAVQRLLDAGAVVVGRTNNPEFCYRGVTDNELFGPTRNPHDPSRTTGGSSGGAAASVASGAVPLAVGTDGGGSIRIPSAFCGTFGLKPTFGRVPKMPGFQGWPTLSVTGPIASSARDLRLALDVMSGRHPADPLSFDARPAPSRRTVRVAVSADLGVADLDPDVRAAFEAAVADLPYEVVAATPPDDDPTALWDAIALPEGYASEGPLVEAHPGLVGADAAAITLAGRDVTAADYLAAQLRRAAYAARWDAFFAEVDILLTAAMPVTAFELGRLAPPTIDGRPVPDSFDAWCALALPANLAGLPAACVPIGAGRDRLPVGLQVLGARWSDELVLTVAERLTTTPAQTCPDLSAGRSRRSRTSPRLR
ncbi:amidase [Jatrophihabitans endophyticus]|uniref:amidase n=1 Tax=Jatrophihabitans endophyticus TaxID=1206085 RepID=UPI001A0088EE|nr:amidase [Jatrophihabitans endophyticus]MBE7186914.1 amidase [Jatrophihabitans endophyticus]